MSVLSVDLRAPAQRTVATALCKLKVEDTKEGETTRYTVK